MKRALFVTIISVALVVSNSGLSLAHTIDCTVTPGGGVQNCYWNLHQGTDVFGTVLYDYLAGFQFESPDSSGFYWRVVENGYGNEYSPPDYWGDYYIVGPSGQQLFTGSAFFCHHVYEHIISYVPSIWVAAPGGYLEQWSAAADCYLGTVYKDYNRAYFP